MRPGIVTPPPENVKPRRGVETTEPDIVTMLHERFSIALRTIVTVANRAVVLPRQTGDGTPD
jgi:hypothetical protein